VCVCVCVCVCAGGGACLRVCAHAHLSNSFPRIKCSMPQPVVVEPGELSWGAHIERSLVVARCRLLFPCEACATTVGSGGGEHKGTCVTHRRCTSAHVMFGLVFAVACWVLVCVCELLCTACVWRAGTVYCLCVACGNSVNGMACLPLLWFPLVVVNSSGCEGVCKAGECIW